MSVTASTPGSPGIDLPVAVDAMGGDKGPGVVVEGVVAARREFGGRYLIAGRPADLEPELRRLGAASDPDIELLPAPDVITMEDSPTDAVREKKQSSMVLAAKAVHEGRASAFISPGNTGAMLAAGTFVLGRIPGVSRPGIATVIPTVTGHSVLIDVGANVDSRPVHLFHFGVMGAIYASAILGIPEPRVGLLSIGEERSKGNELTRETLEMFESFFTSSRHVGRFLGNVEGRDIVNGRADVVVCDGFVGNVVLKFGEGLASTIMKLLKEQLTATPLRKLAASALKGAFREFGRKIDYAEYGGAPLLGVRQPTIICHGSSGPKAIKNAVRVARQALDLGICDRIADHVKMAQSRAASAQHAASSTESAP